MVSKTALAIPIAVGAAGLSLYALYIYNLRKKGKENAISNKYWTEHRMVLNKSYAHLVIGQLEFIGQTSNTMIHIDQKFNDDEQMFSVLMKGTPESVQEAESMVNRLVETSPEITTSILEIPKEKIKIFVGDFGETLLSISQDTGSKLFLKCDPDFYEVSPFYIEIQGPREKNSLAYNLIKQALGKEAVAPSATKWDDFPKEKPLDLINASQNSKYVEVVVSAIISVSQFWVQLYQLTSSLYKMERRIAEYFAHFDSPISKVTEPKLGLMIAVPYVKQGKWHRAKIVSVNNGAKANGCSTLRAMFVDYGDTEEVNIEEIRVLPKDFVHYPYFAVECCLHGVLPKTLNSAGKEDWTEETLDFFESLTSDNANKIFMARKFGDHEVITKNDNNRNGKQVKQVIPSIDLVDTNSSEDVDIATELVSRGYAQWSYENGPRTVKLAKDIKPEEDYDSDEFN